MHASATIIDKAEYIEALLPQLDELLTEGLVVREGVDVVKCLGQAQA